MNVVEMYRNILQNAASFLQCLNPCKEVSLVLGITIACLFHIYHDYSSLID